MALATVGLSLLALAALCPANSNDDDTHAFHSGGFKGGCSAWSPASCPAVPCGQTMTVVQTRNCNNDDDDWALHHHHHHHPGSQSISCYGGYSTQASNANSQSGTGTPNSWSGWGPWGPCSTTCGNGYQTQTQSCSGGVCGTCAGASSQTQSCSVGAPDTAR